MLITSGEHYGAVLNLDFDYVRYLDALAACGFNHTRTWAGAYLEAPEIFNVPGIASRLRPVASIAPFSATSPAMREAALNSTCKFDDAYFKRLRDFMTQASKRGVVAELNLFCPSYGDKFWAISPLNTVNNVNGLPQIGQNDAYTLDKHGSLLAFEEAMVRRIVEDCATSIIYIMRLSTSRIISA